MCLRSSAAMDQHRFILVIPERSQKLIAQLGMQQIVSFASQRKRVAAPRAEPDGDSTDREVGDSLSIKRQCSSLGASVPSEYFDTGITNVVIGSGES